MFRTAFFGGDGALLFHYLCRPNIANLSNAKNLKFRPNVVFEHFFSHTAHKLLAVLINEQIIEI